MTGLLLVAVIVIGYVPGEAWHELKVICVVAVPPEGTVTVMDPWDPQHPLKLDMMEGCGKDEYCKVTGPPKPPALDTLIVDVQHSYWFMEMEAGLALTVKS